MPAYEVREPIDVYEVRRHVRELGGRLGFSSSACLELAVAVSELSTNLLKYGVRGSIEMSVVRDEVLGLGVEIVASDEGPPFHDLESALRDGCDDRGPIDPASLPRRGGLGSGLGAVVRFTDTFRVDAQAVGKRIVARRYRR